MKSFNSRWRLNMKVLFRWLGAAALCAGLSACASTEVAEQSAGSGDEDTEMATNSLSRGGERRECASNDSNVRTDVPSLASFIFAEEWIEASAVTWSESLRHAKNSEFMGGELRADDIDVAVYMKLETWEAIQESLNTGSEVRVGVTSFQETAEAEVELFGTVATESKKGKAKFIGSCADAYINNPLIERGHNVNALAAEAHTYKRLDAVSVALGASNRPEDRPHVLLNPSNVEEEVLAELAEVLFVVTADEVNTETTICTRSEAGWNDCLYGGDLALLEAGIEINGYVSLDGKLEVLLLDSGANLNKPLKVTGTVEVNSEQLQVNDLTAIRIHITRHDRPNASRLEVLGVANFADIASGKESSEIWALVS